MKTSQRVVIYLLGKEQFVPGKDIATAQQLAREKQLPLMVVSCLDPHLNFGMQLNAFQQLESTEKLLARYNVRLMVMLADERAGVSALRLHVQPYIWRARVPLEQTTESLEIHPHAWSGYVQSVAAVRSYAESVEAGIQQLCL